mgnify:CR=1 FL=1
MITILIADEEITHIDTSDEPSSGELSELAFDTPRAAGKESPADTTPKPSYVLARVSIDMDMDTPTAEPGKPG